MVKYEKSDCLVAMGSKTLNPRKSQIPSCCATLGLTDQTWPGFGSSGELEDLSSLSASGWRWEGSALNVRIYAEKRLYNIQFTRVCVCE